MNLGAAPEHLKKYPWYLPHQAWLAENGYFHHDPEGASSSFADLRCADLRGADLGGAYLRGADLGGAYLCGADLRGADLGGAYLFGADLRGADLRDAEIPTIENLDVKILAAIATNGNKLDMNNWHTCETTHCRAGWAIHLAGEAGYALEYKYGSYIAGVFLYAKAYPTEPIPNFMDTNEGAMADMKRRAALAHN